MFFFSAHCNHTSALISRERPVNKLIPVLIMTLILCCILSRELQLLKINSPNGSVSKRVSFVVSSRAKIAS